MQGRLVRESADQVIGKIPASCQPEQTDAETTASRMIYVFLRRAVCVLKATAREIFDESAYDRFLARTHSKRSVTSYRAFTCEREDAIAHKQRCC